MRIGLAAVFLAAAWAGTALGAPAETCTTTQQSCRAQCDQAYPERRDDMGRAGCLARCSWDGAACSAGRALDDTQAAIDHDLKPWLSDQAGRWQRFIDGFRQGGTSERPGQPPRARPSDRGPDGPTSL
jgi:hypothetical protein